MHSSIGFIVGFEIKQKIESGDRDVYDELKRPNTEADRIQVVFGTATGTRTSARTRGGVPDVGAVPDLGQLRGGGLPAHQAHHRRTPRITWGWGQANWRGWATWGVGQDGGKEKNLPGMGQNWKIG